jgi:hypothetical protein
MLLLQYFCGYSPSHRAVITLSLRLNKHYSYETKCQHVTSSRHRGASLAVSGLIAAEWERIRSTRTSYLRRLQPTLIRVGAWLGTTVNLVPVSLALCPRSVSVVLCRGSRRRRTRGGSL